MAETGFDSASYWEARYKSGHTSGAGSVGRLAAFKADFLNRFVELNDINSVIDFGVGDGRQLLLLRFPAYLGVDVSKTAIQACQKIHNGNQNVRFILEEELHNADECDMAISLDVIYHLVEDRIFENYLRRLFLFAKQFVVIYSSDFDRSWNAQHVRHRNFTKVVAEQHPEWRLMAAVPNAYRFDSKNPQETSFSDFAVYCRLQGHCQVFVPQRYSTGP
jgi:hypothetical protein